MKALRFDFVGSLDALHVDEIPYPTTDPDSVVVRVHAAGVNPSDVKNVLGKFSRTTVPRTPGRDFAGVVVQGPRRIVGLPVWGSGCELGFTRDGTHAEYVAVPTDAISAKPRNLSFGEAAACGVPYLTALEILDRCRVESDTTVAIIGMGAVGSAVYTLAHARGARVVAGVRRVAQAWRLRSGGVEAFGFDSDNQFRTEARRHFSRGPGVIVDTSGMCLPAAISAVAKGGFVGVISGPADGHMRMPVVEFYRKDATLVGVNSLNQDTMSGAVALNTLCEWFERGAIAAPEVEERPLYAAADIYRDIAGGTSQKFALTLV